jgi:hypothetical protein
MAHPVSIEPVLETAEAGRETIPVRGVFSLRRTGEVVRRHVRRITWGEDGSWYYVQ